VKSAAKQKKITTILLVDDNSARRSARAMVLFTHGYDVECAASLAAAQPIFEADKPDLLLIGVSERIRPRSALQKFGVSHPQQRVGFLLNEGQELCPVWFDGELLMPAEGSDDVVSRVTALLDR
jgi:hypothetical protein